MTSPRLDAKPYTYTFRTADYRPYADPDGALLADFEQRTAGIVEDYQYIIDQFGVTKNETFLAQEYKAREYLSSLGIATDTPIHVVTEDPDDIAGWSDFPTAHAVLVDEARAIFIRQKRLLETGMYEHSDTIGRLLVHEGFHATQVTEAKTVIVDDTSDASNDEVPEYFRSGFYVSTGKGVEGVFFEEGAAELIAGRYARQLRGDNRAIGITDIPPLELPWYFQPVDINKVPGPDGYTMELLAYGADKKGILTPEQFVELVIDTRRDETKTAALRAFAQVVDSIEPGLYTMLRKTEYDKTNWELACSYVHKVVTQL